MKRCLILLVLTFWSGCDHDLDDVERPCSKAADCPSGHCGPGGLCAPRPDAAVSDAGARDQGTDRAPSDGPLADKAAGDLVIDLPSGDLTAVDKAVPDAAVPPKAPPGMCSSAGWCWQHPTPQGKGLTGIWGNSASDLWTLTRDIIIRFDGKKWSYIASPAPASILTDVWGFSPTSLFISATSRVAYYDGTSFSVAKLTSATTYFYGLWGTSAKNMVAVGAGGAVRQLGGAAWYTVTSGTKSNLFGVWGISPTLYYVAGDAGTVLQCDDKACKAMVSNTTKPLRGVWGRGPTEVYAFGAGATMIRWDGSTWKPETLPKGTVASLSDAWAPPGGDLYVVGGQGTILRRDKTSWKAMSSGIKQDLSDVWGTGPSSIVASGAAGAMVRYDGTAWKALSSVATTAHLGSVWGVSPSEVYAHGAYVFLKYDGAKWSAGPSSGSYKAHGLWGFSGTDLYIVDDKDLLKHFDGSKWTTISACTLPNAKGGLRGLWGTTKGAIRELYTLNGNTLLTYYPAAKVCKDSIIKPPSGSTLTTLWGSGGVLFAGGTNGAVMRRDSKGWFDLKSGASGSVRRIFGTSPTDLWAVGAKTLAHYTGVWSHIPTTGTWIDGWDTGAGEVIFIATTGVVSRKGAMKTIGVIEGDNHYDFHAVWGTSATDIFLVGDGGAILHRGP